MADRAKLSDAELEELLDIQAQSPDGLLHVDDVVESARRPESALHHRYDWNTERAAMRYWRWKTRQLIEMAVQVIPRANKEHRVFVSLRNNRSSGGGYQKVVKVLGRKDLREQMLSDALADLAVWEKKYAAIEELVPVFEAASRVREKNGAPKRKGGRKPKHTGSKGRQQARP